MTVNHTFLTVMLVSNILSLLFTAVFYSWLEPVALSK